MKRYFIVSFAIHILIFTLATFIVVPSLKRYKALSIASSIEIEIFKSSDRILRFSHIIGLKNDYKSQLNKELPKPQVNSLINSNPYQNYLVQNINERIRTIKILPKEELIEHRPIAIPYFPPISLFALYEPTFRYTRAIMMREVIETHNP